MRRILSVLNWRQHRRPQGRCHVIVRALVTFLACSVVTGAPAMAQSRGELLYATHCAACHTAQMHWRDHRAVSNWTSLTFQVRRWQGAASLAWSDSDILDVSRYLNERIYHFEQTADTVSSRLPLPQQP